MSTKLPTIAGTSVYHPDLPNGRLRLDSPAWFAWLSAVSTTGFSYPLHDQRCGYIIGFMTARHEGRQRGGQYWSVYRRQGARLRKIYLGPPSAVTHARLEEVVATLLRERDALVRGTAPCPAQIV
jgi:hypothetical protein